MLWRSAVEYVLRGQDGQTARFYNIINRTLGRVQQQSQGKWYRLYGSVLLFRRLSEHLGLAEQMSQLQETSEAQFPIGKAFLSMVLHRLLDPGSKRATYH